MSSTSTEKSPHYFLPDRRHFKNSQRDEIEKNKSPAGGPIELDDFIIAGGGGGSRKEVGEK